MQNSGTLLLLYVIILKLINWNVINLHAYSRILVQRINKYRRASLVKTLNYSYLKAKGNKQINLGHSWETTWKKVSVDEFSTVNHAYNDLLEGPRIQSLLKQTIDDSQGIKWSNKGIYLWRN